VGIVDKNLKIKLEKIKQLDEENIIIRISWVDRKTNKILTTHELVCLQEAVLKKEGREQIIEYAKTFLLAIERLIVETFESDDEEEIEEWRKTLFS